MTSARNYNISKRLDQISTAPNLADAMAELLTIKKLVKAKVIDPRWLMSVVNNANLIVKKLFQQKTLTLYNGPNI